MTAHVMTDIETMATTPDAAILSIGACAFDLLDEEKIYDKFNIVISLESNQKEGRAIHASTIIWWMQQSKEAQASLLGESTNLKMALKQYARWLSNIEPAPAHLWANDPDFDMVILKHAFTQINEPWPGHLGFWTHRSVRTICEAAYPDVDDMKNMQKYFRSQGTHHSAVDDAVAQAHMVQHCWAKLHKMEA